MKRLLLILAMLLPFISEGQGVIQQGTVGSNVIWLNNIGFKGLTKLPLSSGIPSSPSGTYKLGNNGLVAYDSTGKVFYVHNGTTWVAMQPALVSGTSIKTINGASILGSGDVTISGGGSGVTDLSGHRIWYLSKMGAVGDSYYNPFFSNTVTIGTDNTTIVRAAMDSATAHPHSIVVFDGDGLYATKGFKIPSYTTIYAPNKYCGAIEVYDAVAYTLITNKHDDASLLDTTHPILDEQISIIGGQWITRVNAQTLVMAGVKDLIMRDFKIESNAGGFALTIRQAQNVIIENFEIIASRDGIHFNGLVQHVSIKHGRIKSGDDAIALNADDYWKYLIADTMYKYYKTYEGGMYDINIDDIEYLPGTWYAMRLLSSKSPMDRIYVHNLHGDCLYYGINMGNGFDEPSMVPGYSDGRFGTVVFDGVHLNITNPTGTGGPHPGSPTDGHSPFFCYGSTKNLTLRNFTIDENTAENINMIFLRNGNGTTTTIDNFTLDGFSLRDTSTLPKAGVVVVGATVKNAVISKFKFDRSGRPDTSIAYGIATASGGRILNLQVDNLSQINCAPAIASLTGYIARAQINNLYVENTMSVGAIQAVSTIPVVALSNFDGKLAYTGNIAVKNGNGFTNNIVPDTNSVQGNLPAGVAMYQNFTEGGSTFTDKVGSYNMSKGSGVLTGAGKFGNGAVFTSTSQLLTGSTSSALSIPGTSGNGGVIGGWFKIDPSNTGTVRLMGKGTTGASNLEYEVLYNASTHQLLFRTSADGTSGTLNTLSWSYTADGKWTLIPLEVLVNGYIVQYTGVGTAFVAGTAVYQGTGAFTIGGFIGAVDEIFLTHNAAQTGLATFSSYTVSPYQPQALDYPLECADDTEAAAAGIPVGGAYRTGSTIKTRIN